MTLHSEDAKSLALAMLSTFDVSDLNIDKEAALASLEQQVSNDFLDINSSNAKEARHKLFAVHGAAPSDYADYLVELEDRNKVICGIRNIGCNPKLPFVQLCPNFTVTSKEMALSIYQQIEAKFRVFNHLYMSFGTSKHIGADFIGSIYMVAKSQNIKHMEPWEQETKMKFIAISDDSYYGWYSQGYEEFHQEHPELAATVTVNSADVIKCSRDQGLLKYVEIDGEKAGLISAVKKKLLGHDGIYFNEIFLQKKWKSKGLAKAIQRKFIAEFTTGNEYVWGTIDSFNLPSYKTAYSNGRRPIRYENFVNLN